MFLGDLSSSQQMAGKLDSALASAQKALAIFERLDRQYPGLLNYQGALGSTYNMMSDVHRYRREPTEALAFAQKAQSLLDRLVSEHPKDVHLRIDLAKSHNNIGRMLQQTGEPVEALHSFQRAVDLYESIPNLDPRNNYNLASNLVLCIPLIGMKNGSQATPDVLKLSKGDQLRRQVYSDRAVEVFAAPSVAASPMPRSSSLTPTSTRSATVLTFKPLSRTWREIQRQPGSNAQL